MKAASEKPRRADLEKRAEKAKDAELRVWLRDARRIVQQAASRELRRRREREAGRRASEGRVRAKAVGRPSGVRIDEAATRAARERHAAGVKRLNEIFGVEGEKLKSQEAFFARRTARKRRRREA